MTVTGNPGISTLTISDNGAVATTYTENSGTATPAANNLNVLGNGSITTIGSGSTVTVELTGLTNHNVLVGAGTTTITNVAPGTAGIPLVSNGAAADPSFSTALVVGGGTGAVSFNTNGVVISNTTTTGALAALSLTDGQVVIGSSIGAPAAATLSAGSGIAITNGHNSITITNTGAGFAWSDQAVSFNAAASNGYFVTASLTATLPASPTNGQAIEFYVDASATLTIQANTGQTIRVSTSVSASAGTAANTNAGDAMQLVYRSTNTQWCADSFVGSWSVT